MIIVAATMEPRAGQERAVEDAWKKMVEVVKAEEPGILVYSLHRRRDGPPKLLFFEVYRDEESLRAHEGRQDLAETFARVRPLLASEPVIEFYDEVAAKRPW